MQSPLSTKAVGNPAKPPRPILLQAGQVWEEGGRRDAGTEASHKSHFFAKRNAAACKLLTPLRRREVYSPVPAQPPKHRYAAHPRGARPHAYTNPPTGAPRQAGASTGAPRPGPPLPAPPGAAARQRSALSFGAASGPARVRRGLPSRREPGAAVPGPVPRSPAPVRPGSSSPPVPGTSAWTRPGAAALDRRARPDEPK